MCSLYPTYTVSFKFRSSRKLNIPSQRPNHSSNQPINGTVVISRGKQHTNHERRVSVTKFTESYLGSSVTNLAKKFPFTQPTGSLPATAPHHKSDGQTSVSLKHILPKSCHLRLDRPNGFLLSGSTSKILFKCYLSNVLHSPSLETC
jgi:hypothetical protein